MQSETKICKTDFLQIKRECEIKNSSKSVLQIFFKILALNCENFIGCTEGFREILDQTRGFLQPWTRIELRMPFI